MCFCGYSFSLEEVVSLLLDLLIGHLFHPGGAHVSFASLLLVVEFVIFSLLNQQSVAEVGHIDCVFVFLAHTVVGSLIVKLVNKTIVVPGSLAGVLHVHLMDDFFVLLGPVVRLLIYLALLTLILAFLTIPFALLINKGLVHLQVGGGLVTCLLCLSASQI